MESLERLTRQIKTAKELESVVRTMKALAAVNVRLYEKSTQALADYYRTIELGLHIVLTLNPEEGRFLPISRDGRVGAIVFGSDQGMCGHLNEQIVSHALETLQRWNIQNELRTFLAIGSRVGTHLHDENQQIRDVLLTPSSSASIPIVAQDILVKMEEWRIEQELDRILLFYQAFKSGYTHTPHTITLLPIDTAWCERLRQAPWPSPVLPIMIGESASLFSLLIRQYVFVSLCRALTESLASENASRLTSMQRAERNIRDHLDEFSFQVQQQRQMSVMEELLDIVAAFEALKGAR